MASELAQTAAKIRTGIGAAVKAGTLPPYPDGITFRVGAVAGVLATEIRVWACGVPLEWAPPAWAGAGLSRGAVPYGGDLFLVRSREWLDLEAALLAVVALHYQADGLRTFASVDIDYTPEADRAWADSVLRAGGVRDCAGNRVEVGDLVQYHGSVAEAHGEWTYAGDCWCDRCGAPGLGESLPARLVTLKRREPGGIRYLQDVRPASITGRLTVTVPACQRGGGLLAEGGEADFLPGPRG